MVERLERGLDVIVPYASSIVLVLDYKDVKLVIYAILKTFYHMRCSETCKSFPLDSRKHCLWYWMTSSTCARKRAGSDKLFIT